MSKYQIFRDSDKSRVILSAKGTNNNQVSCDKKQAQLIINVLNRETECHYIMAKCKKSSLKI